MISPALPKESWERSLAIAQEHFDREKPDLVIGSSRGGALAINLLSGTTPLILIAPAWKRFGSARIAKQETLILHSAHDAVVPLADSLELVRLSSLPDAALIIVGDDHRMNDRAALDALEKATHSLGLGPCAGADAPGLVARGSTKGQ